MTALQASIGILNDVVDAPRDAGRKPSKPIPAGLVERDRARAGVAGRRRSRPRARGALGTRGRGPWRRHPRHRLCLRSPPQGHALVVGALRGGDPAAARLRLARGRRVAPAVHGPSRRRRGARWSRARDLECPGGRGAGPGRGGRLGGDRAGRGAGVVARPRPGRGDPDRGRGAGAGCPGRGIAAAGGPDRGHRRRRPAPRWRAAWATGLGPGAASVPGSSRRVGIAVLAVGWLGVVTAQT